MSYDVKKVGDKRQKKTREKQPNCNTCAAKSWHWFIFNKIVEQSNNHPNINLITKKIEAKTTQFIAETSSLQRNSELKYTTKNFLHILKINIDH